jgi:hypothetical protein
VEHKNFGSTFLKGRSGAKVQAKVEHKNFGSTFLKGRSGAKVQAKVEHKNFGSTFLKGRSGPKVQTKVQTRIYEKYLYFFTLLLKVSNELYSSRSSLSL